MEGYEPIHKHKSYFNLMRHVSPSHHQGHHPAPHLPVSTAPIDDRAPAGRMNG